MAADFMRIGDAERDEAVRMLQEHHATGRLSTEEFDDRMTRALGARTSNDILKLFLDLPAPKPGMTSSPYSPPSYLPEPSYGMQAEVERDRSEDATPWYAQWWIVMVAVALVVVADFSGILIAMAALWVWVIYPAIASSRRSRPAISAPSRPLTYSEREYVLDELRAGRKISAIKRYRELTHAGLKEAKDAVDAMERQIGR